MSLQCGGGQGDPGVIGAGGLREAGEDRAGMGYPWGRKLGEMRKKFCIVAQLFQIETKEHAEAGTTKEEGRNVNQEYKEREAGDPHVPFHKSSHQNACVTLQVESNIHRSRTVPHFQPNFSFSLLSST